MIPLINDIFLSKHEEKIESPIYSYFVRILMVGYLTYFDNLQLVSI